jgi:hypothetical protein
MKITIGFELESGIDDAQMITWLNGILAGEEPVKIRKARKPRKPMSDEQKAAFRARMVAGQEAKAKERAEEIGEELAAKSKSAAAKKPASKKKKANKAKN